MRRNVLVPSGCSDGVGTGLSAGEHIRLVVNCTLTIRGVFIKSVVTGNQNTVSTYLIMFVTIYRILEHIVLDGCAVDVMQQVQLLLCVWFVA